MAISTRVELDADATAASIEPLIPGLPDEIAEHCLLHLPFPYQSLARSVSSVWNRAISDPSFLAARNAMSLSLPYIFVFAFHRSTCRLQWQAFDPRSRRWFVLPPMPLCTGGGGGAEPPLPPPPLSPSAFACASNPGKGEIFVLGGMRSDTHTPLQTLVSYKASTNSWSVASPMPTPRSYFAAGSIGGKIFAAGGGDEASGAGTVSSVECYDPAEDRWSPAAGMRWGMSRYDAAVVGGKMYVTEGWTWPFSFSPRGGVYDAERDAWGEMRVGMREGWTGASVVLGEKLFVISECGDCRVKVYDEGRDSWRYMAGPGVPSELRKPFTLAGLEGRIYVVAAGLSMAVGTVSETKGEWAVGWEVVEGPQAFAEMSPSSSHVLYV